MRLHLTLVLGFLANCASTDEPETLSREYISQVYTIDQKYKSMQGPSATVDVAIGTDDSDPELVWVTGYRAEVVHTDGVTPLPPEFMCHSNLSFDAIEHRRLFGWTRRTARRLFTVSQGQEAIGFPVGFGIPLMSDEVLTLTTQVLNHNYPDTTLQARVRVTIDYVRDRRLSRPMTPLYMRSANALVLLEGDSGAYGSSQHDSSTTHSMHGMAAGSRVIEDDAGRSFAGHWIVPPGRQENTTPVTNWMRVEPDATVHFVAVHLHPFAETVSLRDATSDQTLFETTVERFPDRVGLANVDYFSSPEGFTLSAAHEYTLETVYDNPTNEDQEAMAVMYLYLRDDQFKKPEGT